MSQYRHNNNTCVMCKCPLTNEAKNINDLQIIKPFVHLRRSDPDDANTGYASYQNVRICLECFEVNAPQELVYEVSQPLEILGG